MSREDVEVPAEAVLDSGGDFVDQTWDVVGEGAVDDDDVRVEGVENRVQADSDVVGEILHYFAGVGVAFLANNAGVCRKTSIFSTFFPRFSTAAMRITQGRTGDGEASPLFTQFIRQPRKLL